jgi:phosphoglycolate phosphatase-like HAD superfamily hydrolase
MIRGVIFDKDGTLIDFHALWDSIGEILAPEFLRHSGLPCDTQLADELSRSIGVSPSLTDPSGAFACGTYDECGVAFTRVLARHGYIVSEKDVATRLREISDKASCSDTARYLEVCGLRELFGELRSRGIKIGLVTCDTQKAADYAVNRLGLRNCIDFVEGAPPITGLPKPHSDPARRFCAYMGVDCSELAIVGDSMTDISFAKNSGALAVAVLNGIGDESELRREADVILPNVACILNLLEGKCGNVMSLRAQRNGASAYP